MQKQESVADQGQTDMVEDGTEQEASISLLHARELGITYLGDYAKRQ